MAFRWPPRLEKCQSTEWHRRARELKIQPYLPLATEAAGSRSGMRMLWFVWAMFQKLCMCWWGSFEYTKAGRERIVSSNHVLKAEAVKVHHCDSCVGSADGSIFGKFCVTRLAASVLIIIEVMHAMDSRVRAASRSSRRVAAGFEKHAIVTFSCRLLHILIQYFTDAFDVRSLQLSASAPCFPAFESPLT
jgi:hypothetical protein